MWKAVVLLSPLLIGLGSPARALDSGGDRVHTLGTCRIRAIAGSGTAIRWPGSQPRSILVDVGNRRILVAPVAGVVEAAPLLDRRIDAVLLTSLQESDLAGVAEDGEVAFAGSRILVDRTVLEQVTSFEAVGGKRLQTLRASDRLFAPEANVDVLPGVRFTVPPPSSGGISRVLVRCGAERLLIIAGAELATSRFHDAASPASLERADPARLRRLANDRTMLAVTDGGYPPFVFLYRFGDGYRLGSIEAREQGAPSRPSPRVFVEPD